MGLKDCAILFDNPYNTYYAGQTVTGRVEIVFDSPKKVRGIYIRLKGESNTSWQIEETYRDGDRNETRHITMSGREEYFNVQNYLIGGNGSSKTHLPAGRLVYEFTCALPQSLPSSFEGEFGHVRYTVKCVLDRPWKFDQEIKVAFTVLSPLDLNISSMYREPKAVTLEKTFCCCWCKSGPLTIVVGLPCNGFVPGQAIPFVAEIDNISNVHVSRIEFGFRKSVTYYSRTPNRKKKLAVIVLDKVQGGPVPARESRTFNHQIIVPSLPPSNLTNCSLIDIDYEFYVEAVASGLHTSLTSIIPVTIGTVPITGLFGVPPAPDVPPSYSVALNMNSIEQGQIGWDYQTHGLYRPSAPTFGESQFGTTNIQDTSDNKYTKYNNSNYKPMYPLFNFGNN